MDWVATTIAIAASSVCPRRGRTSGAPCGRGRAPGRGQPCHHTPPRHDGMQGAHHVGRVGAVVVGVRLAVALRRSVVWGPRWAFRAVRAAACAWPGSSGHVIVPFCGTLWLAGCCPHQQRPQNQDGTLWCSAIPEIPEIPATPATPAAHHAPSNPCLPHPPHPPPPRASGSGPAWRGPGAGVTPGAGAPRSARTPALTAGGPGGSRAAAGGAQRGWGAMKGGQGGKGEGRGKWE